MPETTLDLPQTATAHKPARVNRDSTEKGKRGARIDYKSALVLKSKGFTFKQIAQHLGVNEGSLRVGFVNKGLTGIVAKTRDITVKVDRDNASEAMRKALSDELSQQAQALKEQPVCYAGLGNTPLGQGRASMVKTIAETAKLVFGWGEQAINSFGLVLLESPSSVLAEPVTDVQSSVVPTTQDSQAQAQVPTTTSDASSTPVEPSTVQS